MSGRSCPNVSRVPQRQSTAVRDGSSASTPSRFFVGRALHSYAGHHEPPDVVEMRHAHRVVQLVDVQLAQRLHVR